MADPDIPRIKRNIGKMIDQGAPESDIDAYVSSEGVTVEQLRGANTKPPTGMEGREATMALSGVPVLGAYVPQAGAAISAFANPLTGAGQPGATFSERYAKNLPLERGDLAAAEAASPKTALAAKMVGGVVGTAPMVAAAPAAFGIGGGSLLGSTLAATGTNAVIGAADAAARGENPLQGGLIGGAVGGAAPIVGRAVGAGINALRGTTAAAELPAGAQLRAIGSGGYDAARATGLEVRPQAIQGLGQRIAGELHADGFRPGTAGGTFDALAEMQRPAGRGAVATVDDIDGIRRVLSREASNFSPQNATNRTAARRAIDAIDDFMADLPNRPADVLRGDAVEAARLITEGRANYAAGMRSRSVERALDNAELNAASANSGANIDNATRQQFRSILRSEKRSAGYSPEELAQMRRVVEGTWTGDIARVGGNLLGGGGGLGAMLTGTIGAAGGAAALGPVGALMGAAPIAGVGLKSIANASTARQARILDELVRSRAPASAAANAARAQAEGTRLTARRNAALIAALMREPVSRGDLARLLGQ